MFLFRRSRISVGAFCALLAALAVSLEPSRLYAVDLLPTSAVDFTTLITEITTKYSAILAPVAFAGLMYWLVRKGLRTLKGGVTR